MFNALGYEKSPKYKRYVPWTTVAKSTSARRFPRYTSTLFLSLNSIKLFQAFQLPPGQESEGERGRRGEGKKEIKQMFCENQENQGKYRQPLL